MSALWDRWRRFARRRELGSWLLVLTAVGALSLLAWVSRHPESPWLERATHWPLVGSGAALLRARLLPPPAEEEPPREPPPEPIVIWIPFGGPTPAPASRPREIPDAAGRTPPFAVGAGSPAAAPRAETAPPFGREAEPTLPIPSRPPDAGRLARALAVLGGAARERRIGSYRLLTDVEDAELLARADKVAGALESVYAARYGLAPVGETREAILLFRDEAAYRTVQRDELELASVTEATGHAGHGLVALYRGSRAEDEVLGTLVHELTHLLTRRAIGPALPPWLDEGISEDLAMSRIDAEGRLEVDTFSRLVRRSGSEVTLSGGEAALRSLAEGPGRTSRSAGLERLLELDREAFVRPADAARWYATAACWVRFLMAEPDLRPRFLAFLAEIAAGAPSTPEELFHALGRPTEQVEIEFEAWVRSEIARLPPVA